MLPAARDREECDSGSEKEEREGGREGGRKGRAWLAKDIRGAKW